MRSYFFVLTIFLFISECFAQGTDSIKVDQITVPKVTITDSNTIAFFMDEFFIPETLVNKMDIIDVSLNGFGENDIVKLSPSDNVYFLQFVSDKAQQRMNEWKFKANFQITAQNKGVDLLDDYESSKPAYNIFGSILKGLNRNYQDYPIRIRFERDSSTVLFELWGYNEELLKVISNDENKINDLLLQQIEVKSDTTLYDCIFIYKTITDTVLVNSHKRE